MAQKAKFMVFSCILFEILLFTFFVNYSHCLAENIYYKDGRTIKAPIVNRTKNTIWVQRAGGSIGIDAKEISKITNDDGSVSKYGADYLVDEIHELIKQKRYFEAQKSCTSLLQVSPDNVNIHYLRGMLNQKLGNTSEAIQDYNFLISRNDADESIFNNSGTISAQSEKYDDATDLFYKAVSRNPNKAEFHNNLAELFMSLKNYQQAIEEYDKVLKLEPNNLVALFNSGVAYKDKGDYTNAAKQWQKILTIKPDDLDANKALLSLENKK